MNNRSEDAQPARAAHPRAPEAMPAVVRKAILISFMASVAVLGMLGIAHRLRLSDSSPPTQTATQTAREPRPQQSAFRAGLG